MKKLLLFIPIALILAGLSGCVKEKEMGLIYVADYGNSRVMVLDEAMSYVDQFSVPFGPECVAVDEDYIYTNSYTADKAIYKFDRASPYAVVASDPGPRAGEDMDQQGDYLYLAEESTDEHLHILKKSDCTLQSKIEMEDWNHLPEGVAADETHIFVSCWNGKLRKYDRSTLEKLTEVDSLHYGRAWVDDQYVYLAREGSGDANRRVDIYKKSDLSFVKYIDTGSGGSGLLDHHVAVEGDYAYVSCSKAHIVRKIKISTNTIVATFGVEGESGSDTSHLSSPRDIAIPPSVEGEAIIAFIG